MDLDLLAKIVNDIDRKEVSMLLSLLANRDMIYLIGNGGSNAICSHISQDYTKALGLRAQCFSDPSRLTCYINDYGRDEAYAKYLQHFATTSSLVILVSSSGNSNNIVNCASYCSRESIPFVILTGFDSDNTLRSRFSNKAVLEFYVPSSDYGIVENVHSIFLHAVI